MGQRKPKKKPVAKKKKGKSVSSSAASGLTTTNSWVDYLDWQPPQHVAGASPSTDDSSFDPDPNKSVFDTSVISWNVLADSYCTRKSQSQLPLVYQRHVFDRPARQHHVRKTLRRLTGLADIIALQEVDSILGIPEWMKAHCGGYVGVETPTTKGGKAGRVDACCLYVNPELYELLDHEVVRLDDIATQCSSNIYSDNGDSVSSRSHNLAGVQSSFCRKNMGIMVKLRHKPSNTEFVVGNVHLYWNPQYEYVKLCQIHYFLTRAQQYVTQGQPFLLCGDFNSQPTSYVHSYITKGVINAKFVAPWYFTKDDERQVEAEMELFDGDKEKKEPMSLADLIDHLQKLDIQDNDNSSADASPPRVRYMLDFTLNRFCRWLRILGIDAALETEEEERQRTKHMDFTIFNRCIRERRTLITTASKLVLRKDCPPGAYLVHSKSLKNMELTLVHLLLSHGVKLYPTKFLTRCVVCNGQINQVKDKVKAKEILVSQQAPDHLNDTEMDVFQCNGCDQGYWWSERPNSSASRVKDQTTRLFEACIRGGVPVDQDLGFFAYVDVKKVKEEASERDKETLLLDQRLDVLDWLQQEALESPFGHMTSAYADENGKELLPWTNVTSDFEGNLDFIFYNISEMRLVDRLYVPTTHEELNSMEINHGHLLPSSVWPSDHLAVGSRFRFAKKEEQATVPVATTKELFCAPLGGSAPVPPPVLPSFVSNPTTTAPVFVDEASPATHGQRCGCGCVPNTLSLFEMAELRKKRQMKRDSTRLGVKG